MPGERGCAPVAAVLLVGIVVGLGAVLAGVVLGLDPGGEATTASLSLSAEGDRVALEHRGGDDLDVRELRVRVRIDGAPLDRQPPVPFFSASGFRPGPTGPFNSASDPVWRPGETASFRIASTNDPTPEPGDRIEVTVTLGDRRIAELDARVG